MFGSPLPKSILKKHGKYSSQGAGSDTRVATSDSDTQHSISFLVPQLKSSTNIGCWERLSRDELRRVRTDLLALLSVLTARGISDCDLRILVGQLTGYANITRWSSLSMPARASMRNDLVILGDSVG